MGILYDKIAVLNNILTKPLSMYKMYYVSSTLKFILQNIRKNACAKISPFSMRPLDHAFFYICEKVHVNHK